MSDFLSLSERMRELDLRNHWTKLVLLKLSENKGASVTLTYSDILDLEEVFEALVSELESRK